MVVGEWYPNYHMTEVLSRILWCQGTVWRYFMGTQLPPQFNVPCLAAYISSLNYRPRFCLWASSNLVEWGIAALNRTPRLSGHSDSERAQFFMRYRGSKIHLRVSLYVAQCLTRYVAVKS